MVYIYDTELYHHGILGQRWGIRRYQNPDGTLTPEGIKRYRSATSNRNTDNTRKESAAILPIAIVLSTYASPLAVSAGIVATKNIVQSTKYRKYKKERANLEVDSKTGLHIKNPDKEYSEKDDAKRTNPNRLREHDSDATTKNCMLCSATYELRRRGYDEIAGTTDVGYFSDTYKRWFKDIKINKIKDTNEWKQHNYKLIPENLKKELNNQPKNSRGCLLVGWRMGGGHALNYSVDNNGKVSIIDPQWGEVTSLDKWLNQYSLSNAEFARLDNAKINVKNIQEVLFHEENGRKERKN